MPPIWKKDAAGWELLAPAGFPDEQALHSLVEQAPQILPLAGSPHLVVLGREVMLGNGYADLLAVEPTGRIIIIEVKLARNAEARRAIVAQILTYAAYLNGLDPDALERGVLANHLRQRGYESVAGAVAANDQEGAFDQQAFAGGLADCLVQGRFRLVLVLDEAPQELVRLIGYLEMVTEDRLTIDLITVSLYKVGNAEVVVPQRVEPERLPSDLPAPQARTLNKGVLSQGVTEFDASLASAREDQRPALQRLRDWAVALHDRGLVTLHTYHGTLASRWTLLPRIPRENVGLVTIYNDNGAAALQMWRSVFERLAPNSLRRVEELASPSPVGQGNNVRTVTDELLASLSEAYQEAAGGTGGS